MHNGSNTTTRIILVLFLILVFAGCENQVSESQTISNLIMLTASDNAGCIADSISVLSIDSTLADWQYQNDSLLFRLKYTANCCSKFKDSVAVMLPTAIAINLIDTTDQLCRCNCTHQSAFVFYGPDLNNIRLSCAYKEINKPYIQILDTVLVLNGTD